MIDLSLRSPPLATFDMVVLGTGPAGQKAAICAAKAGARVLVIDREVNPGGACLHHGTIPSKTLRETAIALRSLERRTGGVLRAQLGAELEVASLMSRLGSVVEGHHRYIAGQLARNGVTSWHGRASFADEHELEVLCPTGERRRVRGQHIVIATGSRPRAPKEIPIDHEHVLDSDSILSMTYLPRSLVVLGAGVIASEYASIFALLGVEVTMIDAAARPLSFFEPELTDAFVANLSAMGSRFLPGRRVAKVTHDGIGCEVTLEGGERIHADKLLCALGRLGNVETLRLTEVGIRMTPRGFVDVDAHFRTSLPHVYAVGDVIGPPALASSAMDQARRAASHALGHESTSRDGPLPFAAYTIPEIASVGLTEAEVVAKHGRAFVGRAPYSELARAHIAATGDGLLKLVVGPDGRRLLGVQAVGEGASELVHIGEMALLSGADVDVFVDATFNYPTLAEGYRVAALDVVNQRAHAVAA
jgi:NAD(P) transhydrogenase